MVTWDTTYEHDRIARAKATASQEGQDTADEASIPVVKFK